MSFLTIFFIVIFLVVAVLYLHQVVQLILWIRAGRSFQDQPILPFKRCDFLYEECDDPEILLAHYNKHGYGSVEWLVEGTWRATYMDKYDAGKQEILDTYDLYIKLFGWKYRLVKKVNLKREVRELEDLHRKLS